MIGIVVSRADHASTQIGEQLLGRAGWTTHTDADRVDADGGGEFHRHEGFELRSFEAMHVDLDAPEAAFSDPDALDFLVFVSKHAGETGRLLTAHFTGNFGPAEYGGEPGAFARAAPGVQKAVVDALDRHAPDAYDVGIECTHHGPTAPTIPSLFVELGSDETAWNDPEGARAVADAVLELGDATADHQPVEGPPRHVVGFGGGHYTPRCTRIVRDTAWAVGHIGSEWQLEAMGDPAANRAVVDAAFAASRAELAVVGGDRPDLEATIEDLGYRVVSETWLRTVGSRPLPTVSAIESALSTVDEGLRFGEVTLGDADWLAVELPDELIGAANGVDADAVWETIAEHTVAFETVEGGTLPSGRAAVATAADVGRLVDRLAGLLDSKYETIERVDGEVVARQTSFDPSKAATLGVPEGPKFGKLAAGEAVTVNGKTVEPHVVESQQVDRFPVPRPVSHEPDT
ncbi:D-aminoacyl-tRNA deacylase [Halohasta salina]|uniref:D-aminoacyl-tRNA deacylase n=1 Tax=Halohasta salina TaxID=2961621 RepID=UPI0020A46A3F|nr:D-aminoacyl-tRNA deacylase [Halohasta salina]